MSRGPAKERTLLERRARRVARASLYGSLAVVGVVFVALIGQEQIQPAATRHLKFPLHEFQSAKSKDGGILCNPVLDPTFVQFRMALQADPFGLQVLRGRRGG